MSFFKKSQETPESKPEMLSPGEDEDFVEVQGWMVVDNEGNFTFHTDSADDANEEHRSNYTSAAVKVYELNFQVRRPQVVVVEATLPDTDGPVTVTIS